MKSFKNQFFQARTPHKRGDHIMHEMCSSTFHARKSAATLYERRRRRRAAGAGIPAPQQRTSHGLVSHHDAADGAATADQGAHGGNGGPRQSSIQADRKRQASAVARRV